MSIIIRDLTEDQRSLLREIAEFKHNAGVEVFDTEVYDDLGRYGIELAGAASIVLKRLSDKGPMEYSKEFYEDWISQWLEWERDAANSSSDEVRSAKVSELEALFTK